MEAKTYVTLVQRFCKDLDGRHRLLDPGDEFVSTSDKPPKHAALKGSPEAVIKPPQYAADTKPKATQAAVKKKVAGLTGQS